MQFDTHRGISDVVARDQGHHEEGYDNARRHVAEQLPRNAPSHSTCTNDQCADQDPTEDSSNLMRADIAHFD